MKKILFKMLLLSCMVLTTFTSMAQGSFAYQAVIRDSKGQLVCDKNVSMRFTLSYDSKDYYQETQTAKTNAYGNISVMVGSGTPTSGSFMSVPWNTMKIMMNVEVSVDNSEFVSVGSIQIQPVPYAMYAASFNTELQAAAGTSENEPLFSVKNADGELVFAVYPGGVEIYVDEDSSKAMAKGFVVSGRKATKDGETNEIFSVNAAGTQVFVDEDASKAMAKGFAVSGRKATKDGETNDYLSVNAAGTQVFVDEDASKAMAKGFAVSGRKATKDGETNDYFSVNAAGTQVFVDEDESKAMAKGFAVSGRKATKDGSSNDYLSVNGENVSIATSSFNVSDKKSGNEVFAVSNNTAKFHADILTTGGIGNVVEPEYDNEYYIIIDKNSMNADDDFLCYELSYPGSITIGDKTIAFTSYPSVYGIAESGDLVEANDSDVPFLYFDDYGRLTQKESENFIAAFIDGNNVRFEFHLKNISDATKFCLIGETVEGDEHKTFRINYSFKTGNSEHAFVEPVQESIYVPVHIKYKWTDITGVTGLNGSNEFEYFNCGNYEYESYGEDIIVSYVDNGADKISTCYVKENGVYVKMDTIEENDYKTGLAIYSLENFLITCELEDLPLLEKNIISDSEIEYTYSDESVVYVILVQNGYVKKMSMKSSEIEQVVIEAAYLDFNSQVQTLESRGIYLDGTQSIKVAETGK